MVVTDIPCGHFTLFLSLFLWHHVYNRMNLCCGEKKTSSKHTLNKYLQTYPPKNIDNFDPETLRFDPK